MSFAKNYLKQYNAESAWNELGAVGTTSAWQGGGDPYAAFSEINVPSSTSISNTRRSIGGNPYLPSPPGRYGRFGGNTIDTIKFMTKAGPEDWNNILAGRYLNRIGDYSNLF